MSKRILVYLYLYTYYLHMYVCLPPAFTFLLDLIDIVFYTFFTLISNVSNVTMPFYKICNSSESSLSACCTLRVEYY